LTTLSLQVVAVVDLIGQVAVELAVIVHLLVELHYL
jgi:hypothetical protein